MNNKRDREKFNEKIKEQEKSHEEERSPLDKYKDQQFADDIPLEDLKIEVEQEKEKHKTQSTSQSEEKYK